MPKVIELKGQNIIDAYDCKKLSSNFGYSCANFNVKNFINIKDFKNFHLYDNDPMQGNNLSMFDIFIKNPDNISCFVYLNNENKIEGRRMFFKGKQLLDHNDFDVLTNLNDDIYYLYGYYGVDNPSIIKSITMAVINKYNKTIYADNGVYIDKKYYTGKEFWIMQIDKIKFNIYPPIDYLYISTELNSFSNFKPSNRVIDWLEKTYGVKGVKFDLAYRYDPNKNFYLKHWNQKYY